MIRRKHRICFRMTDGEFADYSALMMRGYAYDWSSLIRYALAQVKRSDDARRAAEIAAEEQRERLTTDRRSDKKSRPPKKSTRRKTTAAK